MFKSSGEIKIKPRGKNHCHHLLRAQEAGDEGALADSALSGAPLQGSFCLRILKFSSKEELTQCNTTFGRFILHLDCRFLATEEKCAAATFLCHRLHVCATCRERDQDTEQRTATEDTGRRFCGKMQITTALLPDSSKPHVSSLSNTWTTGGRFHIRQSMCGPCSCPLRNFLSKHLKRRVQIKRHRADSLQFSSGKERPNLILY